jgi:hypothetical protein
VQEGEQAEYGDSELRAEVRALQERRLLRTLALTQDISDALLAVSDIRGAQFDSYRLLAVVFMQLRRFVSGHSSRRSEDVGSLGCGGDDCSHNMCAKRKRSVQRPLSFVHCFLVCRRCRLQSLSTQCQHGSKVKHPPFCPCKQSSL